MAAALDLSLLMTADPMMTEQLEGVALAAGGDGKKKPASAAVRVNSV